MSIDHKAQWKAAKDGFGSYIELWVKVLTRWIHIPYALGASRTNAVLYYSRFLIEVDGKEVKCINRGVEDDYVVPDYISEYWDTSGQYGCLIDVSKPGKYKLKLTYKQILEDEPDLLVVVDMVVGM